VTGDAPDLQGLLAQAAAMQQRLAEAQQQIADARLTGTSGGGLVTAVCSGSLEVGAVTIDPAVLADADAETLADLVLAAVRDAQRQAHELQLQLMTPFQQAAGGLGLPGI
jgi:nucleoid-associated protein EbfC